MYLICNAMNIKDKSSLYFVAWRIQVKYELYSMSLIIIYKYLHALCTLRYETVLLYINFPPP
jgi:hypothetical protein